ncbi:hypothetical protein EUBHAL_03249 [Anaerobutyricum hallii DSM 3353]|uniref:Uncharacterized protein n=1 Tax=Anaerobutyricum hallii DSM 3353 TaxID=411469 RepID=C0F0M5_9FIRM|nr:hypothetical protein EUBHAL_03249 [Anaerobutyricum hallii DSM 3353]
MDSHTSVSWLPEQICGKICGRRQENKAIWETKFQRIDTEIHKKKYYFYILKQ